MDPHQPISFSTSLVMLSVGKASASHHDARHPAGGCNDIGIGSISFILVSLIADRGLIRDLACYF